MPPDNTSLAFDNHVCLAADAAMTPTCARVTSACHPKPSGPTPSAELASRPRRVSSCFVEGSACHWFLGLGDKSGLPVDGVSQHHNCLCTCSTTLYEKFQKCPRPSKPGDLHSKPHRILARTQQAAREAPMGHLWPAASPRNKLAVLHCEPVQDGGLQRGKCQDT